LNHRVRAILIPMLALGLIVGCVSSRLHREGLLAIDAGRYEEGIAKLTDAARNDPDNMTLRVDLKTQRDAAVQRLLAEADSARSAGQLDDAERLYGRVLALEHGNSRAQRGVDGVQADRRHAGLMAQADKDFAAGAADQADAKIRAVLAEDPGFAAALALRARLEEARGPVNVVPRLRARDNRPVTLQFRDANTKMVFEVLSRQTGINFIFDKDVRSDSKTTIFVQQVPIEQAIELVLGQNQLARQVLSENMVLIYPNTAQKQKDYQDQIVKTIYLTNADPKQAQNLLKTVLNAKTLFIDERSNQIVIRDTPETVRMAEKLLASLDLPEPEVMMEVEVLEITRSRLQELGINYPTGADFATTPLTGNTLHLADIAKQNKNTITVSPLSASIDLLKQVGHTNVLASPRIRARNREKARILIGSRVPVITNTVTPVSTGAPVVTGSVQYLDVGLTLEVEPVVYLDSDVAIKVSLEVSSILKEVPGPNGSLAYQIGTRDASTLLRLRDGETQILAGLINDQDTRNSQHIPGLGDIPIVGRLFGSVRTTTDKSEIVLSITPRIIRSQPRPGSDTTEFWYGTETSIRGTPFGALSQPPNGAAPAAPENRQNAAPLPAERGDTAPEDAAPTAPPNGAQPNAPPPTLPPPNGASAYAAPPEAASPNAPPPNAPPPNPTPPDATAQLAPPSASRTSAAGAGAPAVTWEAPGQVSAGETFDVTVRLAGGDDLKNIRSQLHYDTNALQLMSADAGDIVPAKSAAAPRLNQIAGVVQLVINASPDQPARGAGSLMVLHFKALTPNAGTRLSLQMAAVAATGAAMSPTTQPPLTIVVAP
jgi:general secretion pathway protein D